MKLLIKNKVVQTVNIIGKKLLSSYSRARSAYLAKRALLDRRLPFDLERSIGKTAGSRFLDLGCGVGGASVLVVKDEFEVYALDVDREQLLYERNRKVKLGINLALAEGQRLPFRERSFDVIYCCHVLEHIRNDSAALMEMERVLKDDGVLLLSVPNALNLSSRFKRRMKCGNQLATSEHLREYGKDELVSLLNSCGFRILTVYMSGFLLPFGSTILNFAVLQFNLAKVKGYLAARFPDSSESIDVVAVKKDCREEIEPQGKQLFPLPWWLRE